VIWIRNEQAHVEAMRSIGVAYVPKPFPAQGGV
jgi:hypothetical protein